MEFKYSYIENLAFAAIQAFWRFLHYILLWKTTIVSDCNPMTYILSCQLLGGNIQNGLSFCRNLIWNSSNPSQRSLYFWLSFSVTLPLIVMLLHWNHKFLTRLYFWSDHLIPSMEISSFISKPKLFNLIPLALISDVFDTKPNIIWSSTIHFIIVVLIPF